MLISIRSFKGTIPKLDARLLPEPYGQVAVNCRTDRGTLRPIKNFLSVNTPSKVGTKRTIFKYGLFWLHWLEDVDVVRGPIAGDTTDRLYWTGEGMPKVSDSSIITAGGGTNYPTNSYSLGIPVPSAMPNPVVVGASVDATQAESRSYVYTYVSAWGEEGPPSPPSGIVAVEPSQSVDLSSLSVAPIGAYNIISKRIYRTATGTTGTEYKYVGAVAVSSTTFSDTVATENLGESLPSVTWDAPPKNMHNLHLHPSGFMVGISGKDICFSVPYMPHAWPEAYRVPIDYTPVGLGIFGNSVLVLTDGRPYLITGTDPEYMTKEHLEINQSCASKRGICDIGDAIAYPSPDGLIVIGPGTAKNITEDVFTREQWQAITPGNLISAYHDGCYYGFSGSSGIVIDTREDGVKTLSSLTVAAAYEDKITDTLYLMVGSNIVAWEGHSTEQYGTTTFRTKIFSMNSPVTSPSVGMVNTAGYPVTVKLYADGVLKHTQSVVSAAPFRIPGGYYASEYEIEIVSAFEIYSPVLFATTMEELRKATHP